MPIKVGDKVVLVKELNFFMKEATGPLIDSGEVGVVVSLHSFSNGNKHLKVDFPSYKGLYCQEEEIRPHVNNWKQEMHGTNINP